MMKHPGDHRERISLIFRRCKWKPPNQKKKNLTYVQRIPVLFTRSPTNTFGNSSTIHPHCDPLSSHSPLISLYVSFIIPLPSAAARRQPHRNSRARKYHRMSATNFACLEAMLLHVVYPETRLNPLPNPNQRKGGV